MADNRSYVYRRLINELGLTPAQAAGAVGGLGGESGRTLDPNAVNPSSGALGIGQWLGNRARGVRKGDIRQQTSHLIAELKGPERGALNALRGAKNINDATSVWVRQFERPSAAEIASSMPARLGYARDAFNAFGKGGGGGGSLTTTTTTQGGTTSLPDFGQQASQLPLIEALTQSQRSGPPAADIQAPSFTAHPVLPEGFGTVSGGGGPAPGPDLGSLAAAIKTLGGDIPATQQQTTPGSSSTSTTGTAGFSTPKGQSGVADFEGKKVAAWIAPALSYARAHGWKGQVNSGYRSFAEQQRIYNSGVRPAAKPGTSNHEGTQFPRGAIDVSDAVTLSKILLRSPYARRLVWAGSKDPVHFSHPHGGHY